MICTNKYKPEFLIAVRIPPIYLNASTALPSSDTRVTFYYAAINHPLIAVAPKPYHHYPFSSNNLDSWPNTSAR